MKRHSFSFRFSQPRIANMVRLAKVELVPSADVGGMLKGVGNLTKDALTFKWAQATMKDVAVNTVVVVEVCDIRRAISIRNYSH